MPDPDPRGNAYFLFPNGTMATLDHEWPFRDIAAQVLSPRNSHADGQFSRAVEQPPDIVRTRSASPPREHLIDAAHGLQRANQHATRRAVGFRDQVQAFVHAIDEVHVGMAGRPEDNARSRGQAPRGMRREVAQPQICLDLYDASRAGTECDGASQ